MSVLLSRFESTGFKPFFLLYFNVFFSVMACQYREI